MLENGAYSRFWADIHMSPKETLQAHFDLGGRALLPIHNGTFDLAFHPWFEANGAAATIGGSRRDLRPHAYFWSTRFADRSSFNEVLVAR